MFYRTFPYIYTCSCTWLYFYIDRVSMTEFLFTDSRSSWKARGWIHRECRKREQNQLFLLLFTLACALIRVLTPGWIDLECIRQCIRVDKQLRITLSHVHLSSACKISMKKQSFLSTLILRIFTSLRYFDSFKYIYILLFIIINVKHNYKIKYYKRIFNN